MTSHCRSRTSLPPTQIKILLYLRLLFAGSFKFDSMLPVPYSGRHLTMAAGVENVMFHNQVLLAQVLHHQYFHYILLHRGPDCQYLYYISVHSLLSFTLWYQYSNCGNVTYDASPPTHTHLRHHSSLRLSFTSCDVSHAVLPGAVSAGPFLGQPLAASGGAAAAPTNQR